MLCIFKNNMVVPVCIEFCCITSSLRRNHTRVYATTKNKSQLSSQPPWVCLQPDTSWPSTPRRPQLSPICEHHRCCHIHCFHIVTWFGVIGGIGQEFQILRQRSFCSEISSSASWKVGRGFQEGKCLSYCQFHYLLIWHHRLICPNNSSLCKLSWWWLFILSYSELHWGFSHKNSLWQAD
jgi:hypothetical protein